MQIQERYFIIIILFITITSNLYSQPKSLRIKNPLNISENASKTRPSINYFFKIGTSYILVDSTTVRKVNLDWIKDIAVLKNKKSKYLYDVPLNEQGLVFYFKKQYIKQVKKIIREQKYVT
jgi:hypothetical protein